MSFAPSRAIPPTPEQLEQAWHVIDDMTHFLGQYDPGALESNHWGALVEAKRRVAMSMDMLSSMGMPGYHEAWKRVLELE